MSVRASFRDCFKRPFDGGYAFLNGGHVSPRGVHPVGFKPDDDAAAGAQRRFGDVGCAVRVLSAQRSLDVCAP